MSLKIGILSTDTKHHRFLINHINNYHNVDVVVFESRTIVKPYKTGPFFEEEQDEFENNFFLPGELGNVKSNLSVSPKKVIHCYSANDPKIGNLIEECGLDILILFGVGKIFPEVFSLPRLGSLNIHRGYIESYRGLDSDLWAIYEKNLDRIGVAIHKVDKELDTGSILAEGTLKLGKGFRIWQLRYHTTVFATKMLLEILERIEKVGCIKGGKPQRSLGKYYSAMSLEEKNIAHSIFCEYIKNTKSEKSNFEAVYYI